jgi:hypothetical protein
LTPHHVSLALDNVFVDPLNAYVNGLRSLHYFMPVFALGIGVLHTPSTSFVISKRRVRLEMLNGLGSRPFIGYVVTRRGDGMHQTGIMSLPT